MKKYKIRNVDIEVCSAEQKIAYNYLFSWTLNKHDKEYAYEFEMNGKKYIQSGAIEGQGKGSPAQDAAVVGDTVGDP